MKNAPIHSWEIIMTIYFSGQNYKYELEGICKLFFPVERFSHVYTDSEQGSSLFEGSTAVTGDIVFSRRKNTKQGTLLWIWAVIGGRTARLHCIAEKNTTLHDSTRGLDNTCERLLALLLYKCLQRLTGLTPSWGILTGVRPVSILQKLRREGRSEEEIDSFFKNDYLVSEAKLALARLTASTQTHLLEDFRKGSYSLYIGIPFCVSRCSYCSFVSHSIDRPKATDKIEEYIDLLRIELMETAKLTRELSLSLDTVYIGGGTPTALSAAQLKRVTDAVAEFFPLSQVREYTIEAGRADTITPEKLEVIKSAGCKNMRISVNPQTFNDEVLQAIGRKHTAAQAEESFKLARDMGFFAINMDFIAGLPGDSLESFMASIDRAVALSPDNITVHTLSIKRSADLFSAEGMSEYAKSGITAEMTEYAQRSLLAAGYLPYYLYRQKNTVGNMENVGYSKPGKESLYNIYIMDEIQTILACGAGGATKLVDEDGKIESEDHISRIFNYKFHFEYIDRFQTVIDRKKEVTLFYEQRNEFRRNKPRRNESHTNV